MWGSATPRGQLEGHWEMESCFYSITGWEPIFSGGSASLTHFCCLLRLFPNWISKAVDLILLFPSLDAGEGGAGLVPTGTRCLENNRGGNAKQVHAPKTLMKWLIRARQSSRAISVPLLPLHPNVIVRSEWGLCLLWESMPRVLDEVHGLCLPGKKNKTKHRCFACDGMPNLAFLV